MTNSIHPVIMLAHNARQLTEAAVESVLTQDVDVFLTLVDNNSTDGTSEWGESHPRINCQTFRPSMGVSAGWNWALHRIFGVFEHCLVVNNDVILRPDTYSALLEDGGQFVTAVSVNDPSAIEQPWRKAPRPHPDFSCFLIRRSVWEKIGPFDEGMKLYASDNDYHLRMHEAGILAYTIGIPFYHYASGTLKSADNAKQLQIMQQADADRAYFAEKWGCEVGSPEYYQKFGTGAPE